MSKRRGWFVAWLLPGLLVGSAVFASENAPAEKIFEDLFGESFRQATASFSKKDDLELARLIFSAVKEASQQPALETLLCRKVYELGSGHPDGYGVAAEAMGVLAEKDDHRLEALQNLTDLRKKQYNASPRSKKAQIGEQWIDELVRWAAALQKAGDYSQAASALSRASSVARVTRSEHAPALKRAYRHMLDLKKMDGEAEWMRRRLKANPKDRLAAEKLITLYLTDLNRPLEARKYSFLIDDGPLKTAASSAGKPLEKLASDKLMTLGDWYLAAADQAHPTARRRLYDRARSAFEAFIKQADGNKGTEKLRLAKARIQLKEVEKKASELKTADGPLALHQWVKGNVLAVGFDRVATKDGTVYVLDHSPHRHPVRLKGGQVVDGPVGRALRLADGTSFKVPDHPSLRLSGSCTIAMWLNPSVLGDRRNPINKTYGGEFTWTLEVGGTINCFWGTAGKNGDPYTSLSMSKPLVKGQWAHVVFVRDNKTRRAIWYKNGVAVNSKADPYPKAAVSKFPILFGRGYAGQYLGLMDEVAIWSRALTAKEIKKLYELSKKGRSYCRIIGTGG